MQALCTRLYAKSKYNLWQLLSNMCRPTTWKREFICTLCNIFVRLNLRLPKMTVRWRPWITDNIKDIEPYIGPGRLCPNFPVIRILRPISISSCVIRNQVDHKHGSCTKATARRDGGFVWLIAQMQRVQGIMKKRNKWAYVMKMK